MTAYTNVQYQTDPVKPLFEPGRKKFADTRQGGNWPYLARIGVGQIPIRAE